MLIQRAWYWGGWRPEAWRLSGSGAASTDLIQGVGSRSTRIENLACMADISLVVISATHVGVQSLGGGRPLFMGDLLYQTSIPCVSLASLAVCTE